MAVYTTDKESQVMITVETGADTFKDRVLKYINPALDDEKVYTVTSLFAGLQAYPVAKIKRRNQYVIEQE